MVVLKPNVVRGGRAIGLGNNLYLMKGRTHSKGGIDIGKNPKTGLEVENNEVMQVSPQGVRVFSAQPILGGISPAQYILGGANPNQVFNAQEEWKKVNRINDDGTKKARFGTEEDSKRDSSQVNIFRPSQDNSKVQANRIAHRKSLEKFIKDNPTLYGINTADFVDFMLDNATMESNNSATAKHGSMYGYYQLKGLKKGSTEEQQHRAAYKHLSNLFKNVITDADIEKAKELGISQAQLLHKFWNQERKVLNYLYQGKDSEDGLGTKISEWGNNNNLEIDYSPYVMKAIKDKNYTIQKGDYPETIMKRYRGYGDKIRTFNNYNKDINTIFGVDTTKSLKIGDVLKNKYYQRIGPIKEDGTFKYGGRKIAQGGIDVPRDNTRVKFNDTTRILDKEELNRLSERNKNIRLDNGLLGFVPIVGDILQGAQGIQDIKDKKYKSGLISLGLLALPNAIEKPLKYVKNFYKSRKYLKSSEKYIQKLYETEPNIAKIEDIESHLLYNGASNNKGDIVSLGYFDDYDLDLRNIRRKGNIIVAKNPNNTIYIENEISKEDAVNRFNDLVKDQKRTRTFDFMKKAKEDYEWLKSGRKVSLINDESLSIDSYPLLEAFAERKARSGFGEIKPVIDANGSYRMIKLNRYGKYRSKKDLDKAIDRLREHTGDKNIPGRIGIGNHLNYVPAFEFYKYKYGGIHIKPSKRGTFTAAAKKHGMSVQGFASKVLANKGKYSSAMIKKANFARNASKWKHKEFGGDMDFNYWITKDNIYKLGGRKKGQWGLQDYSNSFKVNLQPFNPSPVTSTNVNNSLSLGIPNLIGAGLNLAGNVASYFVNRRALKSMQAPVAPSAPTPLRAENLETRVSTAAQEAALRENIAKQENLIAGNLSSSRSRLNAVNAIRNQGIGLYNQLQERKQNVQTELINRAKLNRQQINSQNTLLANQYKDKVTNWRNSVIDFENKRKDALSENAIQHLIQGPIDAIAGERGYFANLENNKRYRISAFLNAIGNPNAVGAIRSGEFLPLAKQFGLTENDLKRLGLM